MNNIFDEIFGGSQWSNNDRGGFDDPWIKPSDKREAREAAKASGLTDPILIQRFIDTFLKERHTRNMKK